MRSELTRELVYLQDNQMYHTTPFLFATNCDWPIGELELLSWKPAGAGRLSTSFNTFQELLSERGFLCNLIEKYKDSSDPPEGYDIIKGATGNY